MNRREALEAVTLVTISRRVVGAFPARKKLVVAGSGLAGLCCACERVKKGFEVVVLEAAGRSGGHSLTVRDGIDDGLYANAGAEHFYRPGYGQLWSYIDELQSHVIAYPKRRNQLRFFRSRLYKPEELSTPSMLRELGYNQREIEYIRKNSIGDLPGPYYAEYVGQFPDEYKPFETKIRDLDSMTVQGFLLKKGASFTAAASLGGAQSALPAVWHAAIRRKRHMAWWQLDLFRIRGGNQRLTDALAVRLGERLRLKCPVKGIEHSPNGVRVQYKSGEQSTVEEADRLMTCMPLVKLRALPVKPQWPERKRYVIENMPHDSHCRVFLESRTRFWQKGGVSPNMDLDNPSLGLSRPMAEEVPIPRGILIGKAAEASPEKAVLVYRRGYPCKSEDIEKSFAVNWTTDPWSMTCLPGPSPQGVLSKFWPAVIEPHGRIHFAGVYADDYPPGMQSAVRSAQRAVRGIENT